MNLSQPARSKQSTFRATRVLEYCEAFTEAHRWAGSDRMERELSCLRVQFPFILLPVERGDRFAGRCPLDRRHIPLAFSPEQPGLGYHLDEGRLEELRSAEPHPGRRSRWDAVRGYWKGNTTAERAREAFPAWVNERVPDDYGVEPPRRASHALYRIAGAMLDYEKLLRRGLPGLRREAAELRGRPALSRGLQEALGIVEGVLAHYAGEARTLGATELADSCEALSHRPPVSLFEAIQLVWLYSVVAGVINFGRMDDYLGPFYVADLEAGRISEGEAEEMIAALWRMIYEHVNVFNGRVIVGGSGRKHAAEADRLAALLIRVTARERLPVPQLSLRFSAAEPGPLYAQALDVIGEAGTFPILYNDDVNIPSVAEALGVSRDEAAHYLPYGCGEYVLDHRSLAPPNGIVNVLKVLELALNDGCSLTDGERQGPATGTLEDHLTEQSDEGLGIASLYRAFEQQFAYQLEALERIQREVYRAAGRDAAFLHLTLLYDDCMSSGVPLLEPNARSGVRYLGGTLETYGNISASDSLTAVGELVLRAGRVSAPELRRALAENFEGRPELRARARNAVKYGNDDARADEMAARVHASVTGATRAAGRDGALHHYLAVLINNNNNVVQGRACAASADGRLAGAPMSNGNNPASGNDRSGLTAFLNSLLRLRTDTHAGAVQNMKLSPELCHRERDTLEALLATYFETGGAQAMITVVSADELQRAMQHPEEYGNLMVRVGGFSEYFVRLSPEDQRDIIARTQY
jgi:pyruvate-formate lyase